VVHRAAELRPATLLNLITESDAFRRPERLEQLLLACEADARSRPGRSDYRAAELVRGAFDAVRRLDAGAVAREAIARNRRGDDFNADAVAKAVRAARIAAIGQWKAQRLASEPLPS
jgi:tRNA nucleotidyltransferase (CCA-adding enzyme)